MSVAPKKYHRRLVGFILRSMVRRITGRPLAVHPTAGERSSPGLYRTGDDRTGDSLKDTP